MVQQETTTIVEQTERFDWTQIFESLSKLGVDFTYQLLLGIITTLIVDRAILWKFDSSPLVVIYNELNVIYNQFDQENLVEKFTDIGLIIVYALGGILFLGVVTWLVLQLVSILLETAVLLPISLILFGILGLYSSHKFKEIREVQHDQDEQIEAIQEYTEAIQKHTKTIQEHIESYLSINSGSPYPLNWYSQTLNLLDMLAITLGYLQDHPEYHIILNDFINELENRYSSFPNGMSDEEVDEMKDILSRLKSISDESSDVEVTHSDLLNKIESLRVLLSVRLVVYHIVVNRSSENRIYSNP